MKAAIGPLPTASSLWFCPSSSTVALILSKSLDREALSDINDIRVNGPFWFINVSSNVSQIFKGLISWLVASVIF